MVRFKNICISLLVIVALIMLVPGGLLLMMVYYEEIGELAKGNKNLKELIREKSKRKSSTDG